MANGARNALLSSVVFLEVRRHVLLKSFLFRPGGGAGRGGLEIVMSFVLLKEKVILICLRSLFFYFCPEN